MSEPTQTTAKTQRQSPTRLSRTERPESSQSTTTQPEASSSGSGTSPLAYVAVLAMGTYLGIVLTKAEIVRWQRVHDMFLLKELHMYLIIGVGIGVAMVSMLIIKGMGIRTIEGKPFTYKPKPYHKGVIFGGMLFGAGWAITGACPGPIYAQLGAGQWMAGFSLAGALLGMFTYAALKSKLPH